MAGPGVLAASRRTLGNGVIENIRDVVYVKPERFEPRHTPRIALDLEAINKSLVAEGRPYALIGFGRWGSSDPWLGIPVEWGQIAGTRVLVEVSGGPMNADLSQGSHFFHNLTSFRVGYLSVTQGDSPGIDWAWLRAQPAVAETDHVRHVRRSTPLSVRMDGRTGMGLIVIAE